MAKARKKILIYNVESTAIKKNKFIKQCKLADELRCVGAHLRVSRVNLTKTVSVVAPFAEISFSEGNLFGKRELHTRNDFLQFVLVNNHIKSHYVSHNLIYYYPRFRLLISLFL